MASEREELIFGLQYDGQNQVADLANDLDRIRAAVRDLGQSVQSDAFTQAGTGVLEALSATLRGQFSALEDARARLAQANLRAEQVQLRSQIGVGQTVGEGPSAQRGFASESEQLNAQLAAARGINSARANLEKQYNAAAAAVQQETRASEAVARVSQVVARRLSESATSGSSAAAGGVGDLSGLQASIRAAVQRRLKADELIAAAAEKDALNVSRLASVDAELAALHASQPYPDATSEGRIGQAQTAVNAATINHELALRQLAEAESATARTTESVLQARRREEAAANSLAVAEEKLTLVSNRAGGASFGQQFQAGFKGVSDRPYAEQIGQAFKFSVLYGSAYKVLFGITQSLNFALSEGIAFQESMTELQIASGQSAESMKSLRQNLSQAATQSGLAPSQGVLIGARSLGLFGVSAASNATPAQQAQVAEISARTVSRAAFTSGLNPEDLQRDLAAIAQAFGGGAAGQTRAFDLDAYLSRRLGTGAGSTYAAVAQSATAGQAAGFNQEQITAIAAVLQARTGQDANTVAGYMAQLFSRSGQGSLLQIESQYGVNQNQSLANQIADLRKIYQANPDERDNISAVFGRGKSQNASIALLQSFPEAMKAAADAQTKAIGAGSTTFNLKLGNVGGQLAVFSGDLKALASELGQSGMLDVVGAAVKILDELVKSGTAALQLFDDIPESVRAVIGSLLLLAAAQKNAALLGGLIPGRGGGGAAVAEGEVLFSSTAANTAATAERTRLAAISARAAALAPTIAGVATVLGVAQLRGAENKVNSAYQTGANQLTAGGLDQNATPDQLQARAAVLNDDAQQATDAVHGFWGRIIQFADRNTSPAEADRAEAARLTALAAHNSRVAAQQAQTAPESLISSFDSQGLSSSLDAITNAGGSARDRLNAVADSLNSTAGAASRAASQFDSTAFAGGAADPILQRLLKTGNATGKLVTEGILGTSLNRDTTYFNAAPAAIQNSLAAGGKTPQQEINDRLQAALKAQGVTSLADISPKVAESLATSVVGDPTEALKSLGVDPSAIPKLQKQEIAAVKRYLLDQAQTVKDIVKGKLNLSPGDLTATVAAITSDTQSLLGGLQQTDTGGRTAALQRQIRLIRSAIAAAPGGATAQVQIELDAARRALADQQIAQLEDLRKAAQHSASSKAQIASIGKGYLTREIAVAVRSGDQDALVQLIGVAGDYGITIARNAINQAIATARAAERLEAEMASYAANELAGIKGMIGQLGTTSGGNSAAADRIKSLQALLAKVNHTASGDPSSDVYATGSDSGNPIASGAPTAAQIAAARQTALAAGSESQISQARAAVATARADMAAAKKGTTDYYSALGAYLQARNSLTDAIQAYHANLFLLGHDATDPIVQAQAQLRSAQAKLRADAGKPADVRAEDQVSVQAAQANVEATKFQQRLDAAQTAEGLGQISFRAYVNYLDNERDRLEKIKHRTYQQQQELNQVDQLLQTASDSMQGVFNFGNINLPKPYQVQRYLSEKLNADLGGSGGAGGSGGNSTTTNTLYIDGADTAKVIKIVREVLGAGVTLQTTKPRHR